jgi:hypothetical protein
VALTEAGARQLIEELRLIAQRRGRTTIEVPARRGGVRRPADRKLAARVDLAEDHVGGGLTGFCAALVGHQDRVGVLGIGTQADRTSGDHDDDHRLAGVLERLDQRLLIRRQLRCRVVA